MKALFQRLLKIAAYTAAGIVILLAVAVGLFRLFLPRLPEYQDEIKDWASAAIGIQVEFTGMDARWGLYGPELKFYGAELIRPGNQTRLLAAEEVGVGVSLLRLLRDRALIVDTVTVRNTSIELRQLEDGRWQVQGDESSDLFRAAPADTDKFGSIDVIGADIELQLIRPGDERPTFFDVSRIEVMRDDMRIRVDATVRLPAALGTQVDIAATQILADDLRTWELTLEADDLDLAGVSTLLRQPRYGFSAGTGDLELALAYGNERVMNATANIEFEGVGLGNAPVFDISGRIDVENDIDGWLVAADELVMNTPAGRTPVSSLRLETSTMNDGAIIMLDAIASYVNLADLELFADWLDDEQQQALDAYRADGVVRNLRATIADIDTDATRYSLSAELQGVGFAAVGKMPGVRGFSGILRADHSSGRLQIDSEYASLALPEYLNEPIDLDRIIGTILWRRSGQRTTILSDSIAFRNSVIESESDIEIVIDGNASPVIDLASTWSIDDINAAKRYIPQPILTPGLYNWLQNALVSGEIPRGTTTFTGPLDKFPFAGGEGRMRIEAGVRNMTLNYARQFPVAQISEVDVVVENTRLFSNRNRSVNSGNEVVNAKIEIPDLRKPVLSINAYSTGTLETLRQFSAASPIADVFGGQLERLSVAGDASLALDLVIPILDWRAFDYTARIVTSNASLKIDGLNAPITELSGAVTVERELITSESLGGRFLGETVAIELMNAPPDEPDYRVIARASGAVTAAALVEELGVPLRDRLQGETSYTVNVLFPRGGVGTPVPLSVRVRSDLAGMSLDLPKPFRKVAAEARGFSGELRFLAGGARIESHGETDGAFTWDMSFIKEDEQWDFDRGMLVLGDEDIGEPDVRGLHIRGTADIVRLEDWLSLSRHDEIQLGVAERIRSIDLQIANLYLIGQHLPDHHVRVDRSARDWLVQLDGERVSGSVFVPYDFNGDRALVLDMERLHLSGDESSDASAEYTPIDPRILPPISVRAADFGLGDMRFGAVETEILRTPDGLVTDSIIARDASFEVVANGSWLADGDDPSGYRTRVTATLTSRDVVQTMERLSYEPGIISDEMGMLFDMSWSGGPRIDFMRSLDGEVQVRFGSGQLDEIEPGAGRVFGLMSVVALPRRLSLDFRDVFQRGLGFDKIEGAFNIEDGLAYTCNLSLESPAATIAIVGKADLVERLYDQTAVVRANVGNTLPVVGAVVAGPQIAAALLLFSQIFKDPLQDIGQVYYSMSGSFDEPLVESIDAEAFAAGNQLEQCATAEAQN